MNYHYRYVCDANNIHITAESVPVNSKGIKITFFLNNSEALSLIHSLKTYTPTVDDVHDHVRSCCNFIKGTSENYIQERFEEDKIMSVLNIHRFLKKVITPNGKLIWRHK